MPVSGSEFWVQFAKMVAVAAGAGAAFSWLWFRKIDPYLEKRSPRWKRLGGRLETRINMMTETLYCAQAFSSPQRPIRYCSKPHPTREAAIAELRRKRPEAVSCMTSEARFNANAGGLVP